LITTRGGLRGRWVGVLALLWAIGVAAPPAQAQSEALAPTWLRAPSMRGPATASLAFDGNRMLWGIDGAVPLRTSIHGSRTVSAPQAAVGLGLSVIGASEARDLRYSLLVDRHRGRAGQWLGVSTGNAPSHLHLGIGFWRSLAPIGVEAGVVSSLVGINERYESHWIIPADSARGWAPRDTFTYSSVTHSVQRTTARGALHWSYGRLEVSAIGGLVLGERTLPYSFAQANVQLQLSKQVLFLAALGRRPEGSLAFDASARPTTMLGVQVSPWASRGSAASNSIEPKVSDWVTRDRDDGSTVIRVRCRHAYLVEVAGDFTDWAPVALVPIGGDRWVTTLTIPPGLHQVQIRMDGGEWLAPPGLPTTQREFAGVAGVMLRE